MGRFFRMDCSNVALGNNRSYYPQSTHVPIPILLEALSYYAIPNDTAGAFQLTVGGTPVGYPLNPDSGLVLDDPVLVPAVTESNIDTTSVLAGDNPSGYNYSNTQSLIVRYRPANASDVGKEIMGIGASVANSFDFAYDSLTGIRDKFVSPPQRWGQPFPGPWFDSSGSKVFMSPTPGALSNNVADWEISDEGAYSGQADGVGSVPWCRPAVWDDFTIALDPITGFTRPVDYLFLLRINHATVKTLTIPAGSTQRVWTFPGSIQLRSGDLVCWLVQFSPSIELSITEALGGQIIWTSRASDEESVLGGGESGGEF